MRRRATPYWLTGDGSYVGLRRMPLGERGCSEDFFQQALRQSPCRSARSTTRLGAAMVGLAITVSACSARPSVAPPGPTSSTGTNTTHDSPTAVAAAPTAPATGTAVPGGPPDHDVFIDCYDVIPGAPVCGGAPPLADGWIAFVAQKGPDTPPEVAQVVQLDGDGQWWPGEERVASPTWSPSGRHLVWLGEVEIPGYSPPAFVLSRPIAFTWDGQRVQDGALQGLERAGAAGNFLPSAAMTGPEEWYLAKDSGGATVVVPLPTGVPRRWEDVRLSERGEDWLWSDDGRSATLRLVREPADHQVIELRASPGAAPTLTPLSGEPDRRLLDWPAPDRLLAAQAIHVLANTNWRNPRLIAMDTVSGRETLLGVLLSDYATYVAPGQSVDRHPAQSGLLAVVDASLGDDWRNPSERDRIALVDVTSGTVRHVTPDTMLAMAPRWSPDGRRLAFAALDPAPETSDDVHMLGNDEVYRLRRGLAIHVLDVETGTIRRLTEPGDAWDSRPEWSGGGAKIVFQRAFDPAEPAGRTRYQVRVVPADGGPDALLLDHVGADWAYRPNRAGAVATGRD